MDADLEQAVLARTRELAAERDRAEAASRAKSSFLATVSHELRTPLNGIIGMTELLHVDEANPGRRDRLAVVRSCAEDLLRQIDSILDLSRIEAGRLDLNPGEIDPGAVAMSVLRTLAPGAEAKGLELAWLPAPSFPARVVIDSGRLRQVLMNLAGNALKFTDAGAVAVRGEAQPHGDGWRLTFHVSDSGPGIPLAAQATLFEPFVQADDSINRRFGGSGLGLSISRRLCEAMGGGISLRSEPGHGATFTASVLAGRSAPATQRVLRGVAAIAPGGLLGESLQLALERSGLGTTRSGHGDVLVLDGDDYRASELLAGVPLDHPLIVLVPLAHLAHAHDAFAGRPHRTVTKPPDPEDLAAAVRQLRTGQHRTVRQSRATPSSGSSVAVPAIALGGARVLYADDQHVNRLVVAGQLKRLGVAVELATGGAEAVALALADDWDVILLDCQMPDVDGFMAVARIRERGCRTPLIAVTAHAMAGDREECLLRGFDDFLAKPVRPAELVAALARWIGQPRSDDVPPPPTRLTALRDEVGDEVMRQVVEAMLAEGPRLVAEAVEACGAGDLALAGRRAHALKGDAANLGLAALATLSKALERAAHSADQQAATTAAASLPQAWRRAESSLRAALLPAHSANA